MLTVKEEAVAAISKLPETVDINGIMEELEQYFRQKKPGVPEQKSHKFETKPLSFLEAAKDYIGCVEGPEDLSTNTAYFQGFGL